MSYSDENIRRVPSSPAPFFRPTPRPTPSPSAPSPASSTPAHATRRASQASAPVSVKIVRPKGKINLIFGIDTSGSNREAKKNIIDKMEYFCDEMRKLLPDLVGDMEIAFVGVSDHCDGKNMIQTTAFSSDIATLKSNIASINDTDGGDIPEAYECLFKTMNGWDIAGANCVFVLFGDSVPHNAGCSEDNGCPDGVNWKHELDALKKKLKAFYFVSCTDKIIMKRLQKAMVDDTEHFVELGGNFIRLTNIVHGIIAKEVGEIDKYLAHLAQARGAARATEVATLLKTQGPTKS